MGRSIMHISFISIVILGLAGCDRNRNNPGYDYFPDMFYSKAYETYDANPDFENNSTMRVPVEGTIPRDFMPFQYTIDPADRIRAGLELKNPFDNSPEVIERGEHEYLTFCVGCHGEKGDGNGFLHSSGLYVVVPRSLISPEVRALRDGEIYHTITLGFGSMGAHGSQIRPEDRWKIISYIRNVLQAGAESDTISSNGNTGGK